MSKLQKFIEKKENRGLFQTGTIGIEHEGHRVFLDGDLATTPHPKKIDGSSTNHYIQRDFAESQLELVTPPVYHEEEVIEWLAAIHEVTLRALPENERIWPYSMPPEIPSEDKIHVAKLDKEEDVKYREHLINVYGKKVQMISGIHYNNEISPEFIEQWYRACYDLNDTERPSLLTFRSDFYLRLARNFLRYQWLVVYLFGDSPVADRSFYNTPDEAFDYPVRSLRNSHFGYRNKREVTFDYTTLPRYVEELEKNIQLGHLSSEKEFYSNVRIRGGNPAREMLDHGIRYLEYRLFDIQGDKPYGIGLADIYFMKYFILYLIWRDETCDMRDVHYGNKLRTQVAEEECFTPTALQEEGIAIFRDMKQFLNKIAAPRKAFEAYSEMYQRIKDPSKTPAAQTMLRSKNTDGWLKDAIQFMNVFYEQATARPYELSGFRDMELSTQILMADAIEQGITLNIIDREDQFLELSYKKHKEYIKNANITAKDTMIAYFMMENKLVTKHILKKAGYHVPNSLTLTKKNELDLDRVIERYVGKSVVVKPKSTNMGIGISIFKKGAKEEALRRAIQLAFKEDEAVMIESFASGTEYRFFIIDHQTKAVLKRIPANVIGDGYRTVRELVDLKNQNSLRGIDHRTPLEKIQLGELEALTLNNQGLKFDSVPNEGERVYLRDNSNISTGGDSVDVTEEVDPSYFKLVEGMSRALGVQITGIDVMIEDIHQPITNEDTTYTFIEANFNPMMMMHVYPAVGKGRRLTKEVLQLLFPEKRVKK